MLDTELNEVRYHIDIDWYKRHGKSFEAIAQSRMCASCKRKLGTEVEERTPVIDPKTGRVAFELKKVAYGSNPFAVFRDCCSKRGDFIAPTTSVLEAVFRLFLANANQPLTMEDILQRLEEWASYAQHGHYVNAQLLKRLLERDRSYGLRPVEIPRAA